MFGRLSTARFAAQSAKPYVSLLFGARQTGKSTLLRAVYPDATTPRPVPAPAWAEPVADPFPKCDLIERLAYRALRGIAAAPVEDRAALLRSYAAIYLEEEVRREAATVNLASFARFLPLAAVESGQIVNYAALARKTGAEVDLILEHRGRITPIEVKWTDRPDLSDARHLQTFLDEPKKAAPIGYIVCRCPRPLELAPRIRAIPWWML